MTVDNTIPLANYEIAQSVNLAVWNNVEDFQGAAGDSTTTVVFGGAFPQVPTQFTV